MEPRISVIQVVIDIILCFHDHIVCESKFVPLYVFITSSTNLLSRFILIIIESDIPPAKICLDTCESKIINIDQDI